MLAGDVKGETLELENVTISQDEEGYWILSCGDKEARVARELSREQIEEQIKKAEDWKQLITLLYFLIFPLVFKSPDS